MRPAISTIRSRPRPGTPAFLAVSLTFLVIALVAFLAASTAIVIPLLTRPDPLPYIRPQPRIVSNPTAHFTTDPTKHYLPLPSKSATDAFLRRDPRARAVTVTVTNFNAQPVPGTLLALPPKAVIDEFSSHGPGAVQLTPVNPKQ